MKRRLSLNHFGFEVYNWADALIIGLARGQRYSSYEDVWRNKQAAIQFASSLKALRIAQFSLDQEDCD